MLNLSYVEIKLCGQFEFWNDSKVYQSLPEIGPCFLDTVPVACSYGFIWLAIIPYLVFLYFKEKDSPLPWTLRLLIKIVLTVVCIGLLTARTLLQYNNGYTCGQSDSIPLVMYYSAAVKLGAYVMVLILQLLIRRTGVYTSGVLLLFWCLVGVGNTLSLYSFVSQSSWCPPSIVFSVEFAVDWFQFLLHCFSDKRYVEENQSQPQCPLENASVLSRLIYSWMTPVILLSYRTTLTSKSLWQQTSALRSRAILPVFLRRWNKVYKDWKHRTRTFAMSWIEGCCYKVVGDAANQMLPIILPKIIDHVEDRSSSSDQYLVWEGYAYAVTIMSMYMIKSVMFHFTWYHMTLLGMAVKVALVGAIYRKSLVLSHSSRKRYTTGEIVNLMAVDCQRVQDAVSMMQYIISLPQITIVTLIQAYYLTGQAVFGCIGFIVLATMATVLLGRIQQGLQEVILKLKGSRIKILSEIINGIKVLKMYTWEIPFENSVLGVRAKETKSLIKNAVVNSMGIVISQLTPLITNYILILIYTLTSPTHSLDAKTAFTALLLSIMLKAPINFIPRFINAIIQGKVSVRRVQEFLWCDETDADVSMVTTREDNAIEISGANFSWDSVALSHSSDIILHDIDVNVAVGELYAIVGPVGCGKSSLISAILGEMEKLQGRIARKGSVAYVPQQAWIQNMSLQDNILFGQDMDDDRYSRVLSDCSLLPDIESLPGGDRTEIGEKGINISGGQKQRVSLARAVYSDADVYLLDDPLSAVDSHVGKHLFKYVIGREGCLRNKTRVLVTHGIHWLSMVDKILVLNQGRISEVGSYDELIRQDGPLSQYISTSEECMEDPIEDEDEDLKQIRDQILRDVACVTPVNVMMSDGRDSPLRLLRKRTKSERGSHSINTTEPPTDLYRSQTPKSSLIQEEQSQKGAVKWHVFGDFAKAMGLTSLLVALVSLVIFQAADVGSNYWLVFWTEDDVMKNTSLSGTTEYKDKYMFYLIGYLLFGVVQGIAVAVFCVLVLVKLVRAATKLHHDMLNSILRSPMSFFDTTPTGRIINRFASDVDSIDTRLPNTIKSISTMASSLLATFVVVSLNTPVFMLVILPSLFVYFFITKLYIPTARQVKRIESVLRSPIYNHFSETITGASVIRAYGCTDRFVCESEERVDSNMTFFFASLCATRWIAVRLEIFGNLLVFAAIVFALSTTDLNGAQVGLSITYAIRITGTMNLLIQSVSDLETNIIAVERVLDYTALTPEAPWRQKNACPPKTWPSSGAVEFRQCAVRYREGLELVLKGITCHIRSGEKIGVVGRTGAGKSSLALSLFRLVELAGGSIYIDGVNIARMGLHDLRESITILSQDPILFSGSIRMNLDPLGEHSDEEIWRALEYAHLKSAVELFSAGLDHQSGEGGGNLSVGQRQLVCLARTLLHKTRILILDEATAAVDLETDDLIQTTIREQFSDCTIITIAHRLNTIMDYDRVMVLHDGLIEEFDKPASLLQHQNSSFRRLAIDAGIVAS